MPKASKPKSAVRPSPLKPTSGNITKKPGPKKTSKTGAKHHTSGDMDTSAEAPVGGDHITNTKASVKIAGKGAAKKNSGVKETKDTGSSEASTIVTEASAKAQKAEKNYLLLTRLPTDTPPNITRLLSVPSTLTFEKFHLVLQIAFGWANCHSYCFDLEEKPDEEGPMGYPRGKSLLSLSNYPDTMWNSPEDKDVYRHVKDVTLADAFENKEYADNIELSYKYDHGDSWHHDIVLLGYEDPRARIAMEIPDDLPIVCLAGEGHPCAEDSGGTGGWEDLKMLFRKPRSRDSDGLRTWYKQDCLNGDPKGLDPYDWDIFEVNDGLMDLAATPGFL